MSDIILVQVNQPGQLITVIHSISSSLTPSFSRKSMNISKKSLYSLQRTLRSISFFIIPSSCRIIFQILDMVSIKISILFVILLRILSSAWNIENLYFFNLDPLYWRQYNPLLYRKTIYMHCPLYIRFNLVILKLSPYLKNSW